MVRAHGRRAGGVGGRESASGTVTLASGSAVVSTGVSDVSSGIDVFLDPSGGGANSADVKASARAFWDNSVPEYKVEILEDGTSVGNPTVGYTVVTV
jgi:X-X-X-Leu-X-X-Gly heptad repeat protein